VDETRKTKEHLIGEMDALRRRVAELESAAADHTQTTHRLAEDVRVSEAALRKSEATERALSNPPPKASW